MSLWRCRVDDPRLRFEALGIEVPAPWDEVEASTMQEAAERYVELLAREGALRTSLDWSTGGRHMRVAVEEVLP